MMILGMELCSDGDFFSIDLSLLALSVVYTFELQEQRQQQRYLRGNVIEVELQLFAYFLF